MNRQTDEDTLVVILVVLNQLGRCEVKSIDRILNINELVRCEYTDAR